MNIEPIYTLNELSELDASDLLLTLKEFWSISSGEPISVWGVLDKIIDRNGDLVLCKLQKIKTKKGNIEIEYPISNLLERNKLQTEGAYIPRNTCKNFNSGDYLTCDLTLSVKKERDKRNNPMLLCGIESSIKFLDKIPIKIKNINYNDVIEDQRNLFIERIIVKSIIANNREEFDKENKINIEKNKTYQEGLEIEHLKEKNRLDDINLQIKNDIKNNEEVYLELDKNYENLSNKEIKINTKVGKKEDSILKLNEQIKKINKNKSILKKEIEKLKVEKNKEAESMSKQLENFRRFVKTKADILYELRFIDKPQYDQIMMKRKIDKAGEQVTIDFSIDLGGDFSKAVSHIHAYLFEKEIMYPRYIIEDFFALIQTNDLIILAGESGSGKTHLVKSFAEAVGGVCEIIPVKPNWTSSEDLLGYYNPLEGKYLATPFLEALIKARGNPEIPYFICLDEMNLARVEYYFSEFLSVLEERTGSPEIKLYPDVESTHVISEFENVLEAVKSAKEKFKKNHIVSYIDILKDGDLNNELTRIFGFSDKDSLIKYHSDLRKMIIGVLNVPASIIFPENVRIIGTINVDETTHYLSPKIIDRAHVMKFDNPLLYDLNTIKAEISDETDAKIKLKISIEDLVVRDEYPKFNPEDKFCKIMVELTKEYLMDLGIDVGFRTIRQGLNYKNLFGVLNPNDGIFINNFILHKILPKFTFDGSTYVGEKTKLDILKEFKEKLQEVIGNEMTDSDGRKVISELDSIIKKSPESDGTIHYWA